MTTPSPILGVFFDVDGSVIPEGQSASETTHNIFQGFRKLNIPYGPVSGRPLEFLKGLEAGIGPFAFMAAESGGVWAERQQGAASASSWSTVLTCESEVAHIKTLESLLKYDRRFGSVMVQEDIIYFEDEPKYGELSLLPKGGNSLHGIVAHLEALVGEHQLPLKVKPYPNGSITVSPIGSHKGLSVDLVSQALDCKPEAILTVVDGGNDWELAEHTTSIAVGNAGTALKEFVRAKGDLGYIAEKDCEYGFAEGLRHFVKQGRLPSELLAHLPPQ